MYADHSAVDMPIIRSWASSGQRPPRVATKFLRTRSQTGSESMSTPSTSNTTASITHTPGKLRRIPQGSVRISWPSSVTRIVCSNCAVRLWSFVTAVHPSGQMS